MSSCRFLLALWITLGLCWHPAPAMAQDPSEYMLAYGDTLAINSSVQPSAFHEFVPTTGDGRIFAIRPDGRISLPLIGAIEVGGLTATQVGRLLEERYKPFFGSSQFVVNVVTFRPITVAIMGEVNRAGVFPFLRPPSLLEVLAQGGGITDWGDRQRVRVVRQGRVVFVADLERVMRGEQPNWLMENADSVQVDTIWYKSSVQTLPMLASMAVSVATLMALYLRR